MGEGLTVKAVKEKRESFWNFVKYGNAEDAEVEYIEDCFADMKRPRFGWRAKVTFMENEPCEIDSENPERTTCRIKSISNNEDETNYYYAQSRQTGENFRSAAPPDCRIEYVCDAPPAQRRVDTFSARPVEVQPAPVQPVQPAPAEQAPVQIQLISAKTDSVQPNPVQSDLVQPDPVSVQPGQVQLDLVQQDLAQESSEVEAQSVPAISASDFETQHQAESSQPQSVQVQEIIDETAPIQSILAQSNSVQSDSWLPVER